MPEVSYTAVMEIPRPTVWDFVRDMNNWAPLAKGYQTHEILNDRESIWTIKGEVGPISRTTKFHITITEWVEGERVAFTLEGLNEPITGEGAILISDSDGEAGTDIRGDATLTFGGSLGPILNQLIGPWVQQGADELVTAIATTLQPTYVRPSRPFFLVRWISGAWNFVKSIVSAPFRGAEEAQEAATVEPTPAATPAPDAQIQKGIAHMNVETLLVTLSPGQYAGATPENTGPAKIAETARQLEAMGFDGLTTPETGHDPFLPIAIAAEHTTRVSLGTNVAIAFPRTPMVVAQMAWDLQQWSGGRFNIGLGTQVKGHNERRYSAPWPSPPGPRMREYVQCLKAIFNTFKNPGQPDYFSGEHYQFTLMPPFFNPGPIEHPDIPIYISALNPYMARLAGELCDGLRLHPLATLGYTKEVVIAAVEAGAKKAGRDVSDIDLVGSPFIITGKDDAEVEANKAMMKQQIAFYASTRTYHRVLEFHGWSDVGMGLHRLSVEGKWGEMPNLITEEILEEFAVIATYDKLIPKLKERWGEVLTTVFLGLSPAMQQDEDLVQGFVQQLHS